MTDSAPQQNSNAQDLNTKDVSQQPFNGLAKKDKKRKSKELQSNITDQLHPPSSLIKLPDHSEKATHRITNRTNQVTASPTTYELAYRKSKQDKQEVGFQVLAGVEEGKVLPLWNDSLLDETREPASSKVHTKSKTKKKDGSKTSARLKSDSNSKTVKAILKRHQSEGPSVEKDISKGDGKDLEVVETKNKEESERLSPYQVQRQSPSFNMFNILYWNIRGPK